MTSRSMAAVRGAWAATLATRPRQLIALTTSAPVDDTAVTVARVLAARQAIQAAVTFAWPRPVVRRLGAVTDALHALSGIGLAIASRRWRRTGLADAVLAGAFAVNGWRQADLGRANGS